MTLPSRSALFSLSARKTMPLRPDCFHWASRWRASTPSGDDDEIVARCAALLFLDDVLFGNAFCGGVFFGSGFFGSALATRAFLVSLTWIRFWSQTVVN
ncbi:hypothetical protein IVA79_25040 [Bradyrhizobium sp. 138]|uniref:hypothetical protein n=1 Tax=Bradyrhizobium sp. 138 TaxID=2782615 RepID=UPI001FF7451E|nr:hypothetical protein [Bradyrhizobium sp. 138]